MAETMLFQGWEGVVRTLVVGTAAYVALILVLRISGKRTLSKLNAFDFVITVALGSTVANILLDVDVALTEGVTALGLLVLLQFVVTWTSVRWPAFKRVIRSEPTVLVRAGVPVESALKRERVTRDELLSAVRDSGGRDLADAEVVMLEADGSLSAILKS